MNCSHFSIPRFNSPIMAIDVTNRHIGIALAYHRQQSSSMQSSLSGSIDGDKDAENNNSIIATSITPLPPIPYMSHLPYHPSYAFLHHHFPEDAHTPRCLDRVERTMEVADQLAQLATNRQVKGILVRWPGELASAVVGGETSTIEPEPTREAEEGQLLFSKSTSNARDLVGVGLRNVKDGSVGYMRGRILYLLDKCCTTHGHAQSSVHLEPLLMEGSRPFAFFDTSMSERDWITDEQPTNKKSRQRDPKTFKCIDKYGNSFTEMDLWGRCPIFGNDPPQPQQGKFYYSSMETYSGYKVSCQFKLGSDDGNVSEVKTSQFRSHNFDGLHGIESMVNQFKGSLSAMHALSDFAKENLHGRIVLPVWASTSSITSNNNDASQNKRDVRLDNDSKAGSHPGSASYSSSTSSEIQAPDLQFNQSKAAVTLAKLPNKKKRRGKVDTAYTAA